MPFEWLSNVSLFSVVHKQRFRWIFTFSSVFTEQMKLTGNTSAAPVCMLLQHHFLFLKGSRWTLTSFFHLQRKPRKGGDSAEDSGHMRERVDIMDVVAICRPKYKDRPQIAKVIQKTKAGYSIHWMTGSYSGPWAVAKKRDGRKKVPWVDNIKESDIIYKKIALTSGQKLTNKVAQTLRALYAAKEGTKT